MKLSIELLGLLLIAAQVVAAAKNSEMDEKLKELFDACAKEMGMTEEKIESSNFREERNRDRDCFDACTLRKLGVMESGKLLKDVAVKLMEETEHEDEAEHSEFLKAVDICIDEAGTSGDDCELAGSFTTCFLKKTKEIVKE